MTYAEEVEWERIALERCLGYSDVGTISKVETGFAGSRKRTKQCLSTWACKLTVMVYSVAKHVLRKRSVVRTVGF